MKYQCTCFLIFIFSMLTGSIHAGNLDPNLLRSLGEVKYHELRSSTLKRPFHIFVDLPGDYQDSGETYPTIYLLDGDITFPLMAGYHHYLRADNETPAAILVGISYGAETFEEGNMRSTDYTAPTDEREYWGGAADFQTMLSNELLPLIESTYRSDPARRIIFGQSIGGQFVFFTAFTQPKLFHGHIASNPALHRNLPFFLQWHSEKNVAVTSRVFVSSGEFNDPRFHVPALKWIGHWEKQDSKPWALKTRTLAGQTHFSAAPEAFRLGLEWIYATEID